MNATLAKLRKLPNPRYNPIWPEGTRQELSKPLAERFFSLLASTDVSLLELLRQHPELPPFKQLDYWRRHTPWFCDSWRKARQTQADFLVQKCLDLAEACTPKNAHVTRVKFDILCRMAAKFYPEVYGDKTSAPTSTTVNVGIAISPERLADIRSKLDITRSALLKPHSEGGATPHANATPEPAVVSRAQEHRIVPARGQS